jgi:SAM-dependent methyltransferase
VDIGSGNRRLGKNVINVDIHPWEQVDILADAHNLPFADSSVDGLVFSWVLEHMKDPLKVESEFRRVLRPGGCLYLSTNFIFPYHPSPRDYYRWTTEGLRELFRFWDVVEIKPTIGPMAAFLSVFQEWASLLLSFNIRWLKDLLWMFLVIATSPLKLLDLVLIHYKFAENISAGFYLIARKK